MVVIRVLSLSDLSYLLLGWRFWPSSVSSDARSGLIDGINVNRLESIVVQLSSYESLFFPLYFPLYCNSWFLGPKYLITRARKSSRLEILAPLPVLFAKILLEAVKKLVDLFLFQIVLFCSNPSSSCYFPTLVGYPWNSPYLISGNLVHSSKCPIKDLERADHHCCDQTCVWEILRLRNGQWIIPWVIKI